MGALLLAADVAWGAPDDKPLGRLSLDVTPPPPVEVEEAQVTIQLVIFGEREASLDGVQLAPSIRRRGQLADTDCPKASYSPLDFSKHADPVTVSVTFDGLREGEYDGDIAFFKRDFQPKHLPVQILCRPRRCYEFVIGLIGLVVGVFTYLCERNSAGLGILARGVPIATMIAIGSLWYWGAASTAIAFGIGVVLGLLGSWMGARLSAEARQTRKTQD